MFAIKCYNTTTGHVETVSGLIDDESLLIPGSVWTRDDVVARFASNDQSCDHAYYADEIPEYNGMAVMLYGEGDE